MKNKKQKKNLQKQYAKDAIDSYIKILESGEYNSVFDTKRYVKEIIKFQTAFKIELSKDIKLKFCKKCFTFHKSDLKNPSLKIRFNSKIGCKEYICQNCGHIKRFKYK